MVKKVSLVIIGILVVIIAVAGIAYATGALRPPQLEDVQLSWGQVTSSTTDINAEIKINNRLPFGIGTGSIGVDVPVYFYDFKAADLRMPGLNLPSGESSSNTTATFVQDNLPQWWPQFVQQGEKLAINIKPTVKANVLGMPLSTNLANINTQVSIPIMSNMKSSEPFTMGFDNASIIDIAQNPGAHFVVSPPAPARPILTIESWELHWGDVTQQQTQIMGTITVRNELPVPMPIQGIRLGLDMNKIAMVPNVDITPSRSELPPGQSIPLDIKASTDNNKLVEWWASHIQNGEETVATARLGLTVVLPVTSGLGLSQPVQLPLQPVPLFECDIQTHIMDVANYQIAKILGKPVGTEPQSYSVKYNVQSPQLTGTGPLSPPPITTTFPNLQPAPTPPLTTNPFPIPTSTPSSPPITFTPPVSDGQTTTTTLITSQINSSTVASSPTLNLSLRDAYPGTQITVSGNNFTPDATIKSADILFNGVPCTGPTYNVDSAGNVSFPLTIPSDCSPGSYSIAATDSAGKKTVVTLNVISALPTITLSPASAAPGTLITVYGYNFTPNGTVKPADILFGDAPATGSIINIDGTGSFELTLTIPDSYLGSYSVGVFDSGGKKASAVLIVQVASPPIIALYPVSCSPGSLITVTCYNFTPYATISSADVLLDGVPLTAGWTYNVNEWGYVSFVFNTLNEYLPGSYNVVVTDSSGKQARATFTIGGPPTS